jgi:mycothiol synthase
MELTIRPFEFTDADYEAAAAVERAAWPDHPDTVEEWKHRDQTRDPQYLFRRYVVEVGGGMVASAIYCVPWWSVTPGKYFVNMTVHPDHRGRGIGTALYNHLTDLVARLDPRLLLTATREDQADALRFLTKRGFEPVMRYPVSYLDVEAFDPTPFAGTLDRVKELGIEIKPLSQLTIADADWKRKLWDLDWALTQDVPLPEPPTRKTFETFERSILGSPGFTPDGQYIALDGGQWVGMSGLWTSRALPERLYTSLTGVVRSHRRRGIATALKVRAIGFAKEHGAKLIETDNEENNPMYQLNLNLGFQPQPAWLDLEKTIKEESG